MITRNAFLGTPERGLVVSRREQRRREVRRGVELGVEAVAEDGFRLLGRRTLDVSADGMLLEVRSHARIGEEVIVSFRPPGSRLFIDAVARIARIARGRRRGDAAHAVGLSFVSMDPVDRAILEAKLRGHPPRVPHGQPPPDYAALVRIIAGA